MTDNDAFDKFKNGDTQAMEWLFRTKRDHFIGYFIKHYGLSETAATDLAKDALIGLVASAERNKERELTAQLSSLWITIGKNMYLSAQKKADKLPIVNWDDFMNFTKNTEGAYNPFDTDAFEEALPLVMPKLATLKALCQTIIQLFYLDNLTDKEISENFINDKNQKSMSQNAIKMKRLRCMEELRQLIFNHLKTH